MGYVVPGRPPQPNTEHPSDHSFPPIINISSAQAIAKDISSTGSSFPVSNNIQSVPVQNQEHSTCNQAVINNTSAPTCFTPVLPELCSPLHNLDIAVTEDPVIPTPARPLLRPTTLPETCYILPGNTVFVDKVLPHSESELSQNIEFPIAYFVALHNLVSTPTPQYEAYTPNYLGARIPLQHTKLNIDRWKHHLIGYEGAEIIKYLQFGFPLGLSDNPPPALVSTLRNHGSSYQFYKHIDDFLKTGLSRRELSGPCRSPPFPEVHISPLMTAVKKPDTRRAVFDATFGDYSLNNSTPTDTYLHEPFEYDFPKVEDFKRIVLKYGPK